MKTNLFVVLLTTISLGVAMYIIAMSVECSNPYDGYAGCFQQFHPIMPLSSCIVRHRAWHTDRGQ